MKDRPFHKDDVIQSPLYSSLHIFITRAKTQKVTRRLEIQDIHPSPPATGDLVEMCRLETAWNNHSVNIHHVVEKVILVFHNECIQWRKESACLWAPVELDNTCLDCFSSCRYPTIPSVCVRACVFSHASRIALPRIGTLGQIMQEHGDRDWHRLERKGFYLSPTAKQRKHLSERCCVIKPPDTREQLWGGQV